MPFSNPSFGAVSMADTAFARCLLLDVFAAALRAVEGRAVVGQALVARPPEGPVWICAIGKAAQSMALGACDALGSGLVGGLLITKPGHLDPAPFAGRGIECLLGGHPVPDAGSLAAGQRLLCALGELRSQTEVLFLLSGGASSLVEVPVAGLDLADLRRMNRWLLGSGLPIDAVNRVRKSVSRIKGGGLLSALGDRPTRVLAISDVPGDDPGVIGSGLLVPEVGLAEGIARLDLPAWLSDWVERGLTERGPLPRPGPCVELVATLDTAKAAAAEAGRRAGLAVRVEAQPLEGDAVLAGRRLARALLAGPPGLSIAGGETTLRLPDAPGRGGRNQHLALAAAIELAGHADAALLSAGTDGTDGPTEDAGALVDGATLERIRDAGLDAAHGLRHADSGRLLEASGDLIRTGPTGTNVMDLILGWRG
ncbi:Hydroxypyruvate reductase [Thiocapsa marina 5811]|uniref:Hydroxypyruvate reductase n=2 Tax=Thiocapsa marina TaxID=244573 RepID=F9U5C5_9GAMM|nr:Hydroxypyruvate reductase [Thiocapsa marina 5811]